MRRLALLLLVAAPLAARAERFIQLDLRAGAALPFGETTSGAKLSDQVDWAFPLQADLQYRFLRSFSAGAYARYAPAAVDSGVQGGCKVGGYTCSASDLAFGALGEYRFSDRPEGGPFLGAQVGWERLRYNVPVSGLSPGTGTQKATVSVSGIELGVSGGWDFELGAITLGPWASLLFGQFSGQDVESGGGTTSGAISSRSWHGWFQAGVRSSMLF